jgi:hypothetical protein
VFIMKILRFFITLFYLLMFFCSLSAQKTKPGREKGATFNFENFQFSTNTLYKEPDPSGIKALRLSVREICDTVAVNSFVFCTTNIKENRISLADLLMWAIEKKNLTAYDPLPEFFSAPISWDNIKNIFIPARITFQDSYHNTDSIIVPDRINTEDVRSYYLLESSLYDKNGKIVEVRPIGLCPVWTKMDDQVGRILKRPLFWVYFPDIMPLMSNYIPEVKIKGVKTTLAFFTKNLYRGECNPYCNFYSPLLEGRFSGDTARYVDGFDVSWIFERVKNGTFIDPGNKFFQGLGRQEMVLSNELSSEPDVDRVSVACAKFVYRTINLRDVENYPLFFSENPFLGQRSLIDVIYSGIKDGIIIAKNAFDESSPMTLIEVEEAMGKKQVLYQFQNIDGGLVDTTIWREFTSSEVKKYIIKELEFYDVKGILKESRILGLIPVREWRDEFDAYEDNSKRINKSKLFYVSFNNPELRRILLQNYAFRFTSDDNISFLSFFKHGKYKTENTDTQPAAVSAALKECGIIPVETAYTGSFLKDITIKPEEQPKIVFREVLNKDTVNYQLFPDEAVNGHVENYQLFQPAAAMNGLIDFFDLIMSEIEKGSTRGYTYNPEGEFESELKLSEIKRITRTSEDTSRVIDIRTGIEYLTVTMPDKPFIKKYIIKEIHTGSAIYILGVCPVMDYFEENDYDKKNPKMANTFWIPFTKTFMQVLLKQEIIRMNCEEGKSFGDYFMQRKYKGIILHEKILTPSELKEIQGKL